MKSKLSKKHKENISNSMKGKTPKNFKNLHSKKCEIKKSKTMKDKWKNPTWDNEKRSENISKKLKGKSCQKRAKFKEDNPNWRGGRTNSLSRKLRNLAKYNIWRSAVFLRDDFICQNPDCKFCNNKIGVMIHPHHKKPISLYPELAFNLNNVITYCEEFHLKSGLHRDLKIKMEVN